jgi:hypothetical protein
MLLSLYVNTPTAITSVRAFQAVLLKSVEVWSNPVALGSAPTGCFIEWLGENSPSTIIEDVSMGVRPAHVFAVPPLDASNRWWSVSGSLETDVLFNINVAANSIIDVTIDGRFPDIEAPTNSEVPAGATIGKYYGNYLDGHASAKLSPVGLVVLP